MRENLLNNVGLIEGYAARLNERDLNRDKILHGAFGKILIPGQHERVKMLYQHNVENPIGRWTMMREDFRGLFVKGEIFLTTDLGRNVWQLIKGGALDGLSIGYRATKTRRTKQGRDLLMLDLWEISIVTFPMANRARITAWQEPESATPPPVIEATLGQDISRLRHLMTH